MIENDNILYLILLFPGGKSSCGGSSSTLQDLPLAINSLPYFLALPVLSAIILPSPRLPCSALSLVVCKATLSLRKLLCPEKSRFEYIRKLKRYQMLRLTFVKDSTESCICLSVSYLILFKFKFIRFVDNVVKLKIKITERNTNPPYSLTFKAKSDPGSYWLKADQSMVIPVTGSLWLTKVPC